MVSALETVRFATSQALLKALRDTETEAESAGSLPTPMAGILREYGIDTAATGQTGVRTACDRRSPGQSDRRHVEA